MVSPGSIFPLYEALALGVGQLPCVELLSISHQAMMMAKGSLLVLAMGWDLVEWVGELVSGLLEDFLNDFVVLLALFC